MRASLLSVVLVSACATQAPPPVPGALESTSEVVLTVDGHEMRRDVVNSALDPMPKDQLAQLASSGQLKEMIEQMALGEVLYHKALEQGLDKTPDMKLKLAMAERDALAQAVVEAHVDSQMTDAKLQEAYDAKKVQFAKPSAKVAVALFDDAAKADEAKAKIDGGTPFGDVAKEMSIDRSTGENGGDLGWIAKGQLAEAVDKLVFSDTPTTGVIGPVDAGGRWFLISVSERRDATPLEEVRGQLEGQLRGEIISAYIEELKSSAKVEWKVDVNSLAPAEK